MFYQYHNASAGSTGSTTISTNLVSDVPIGNVIIVCVGSNAVSGFYDRPNITGISKPGGESASWTKLVLAEAYGNQGIVGETWAIKTTTVWPSGTSISATLSQTTGYRMIMINEFGGVDTAIRGTAGYDAQGSASFTNPPLASTSGTLFAGDLVIGHGLFKYGTAPSGDSDTLDGSWSTPKTIVVGTADTIGSTMIFQYKVLSSYSGNQSYSPTHSPTAAATASVVALAGAGQTFAAFGVPL